MTPISALSTILISLTLVIVTMPLMRKGALAVGLVDKPNNRKVHTGTIPLVGGITIWMVSMVSLKLIASPEWLTSEVRYILAASGAMLLLGLLDDKLDLRASIKLLTQLIVAYFAFEYGIRIESLHGVMGIHEIPMYMQYFLTVVIITGVINAFNLMDGIDGLAATIALNAFILFAGLALITGQLLLMYLFLALIGALVGFLRFNLSKKQKVFMGDAGSLFIGTILVLSAIVLIQSAQNTSGIKLILSVIVGVLTLPVLDSLRVYRRRAKDGFSPFRADRTHFHHLILQLGMKPRTATLAITGVSMALIILSVAIGTLTGITVMVVSILTLFIIITTLLTHHNRVDQWRRHIKELELRQPVD
jgi:UDP-GlcNAc:undecaprenyl-phosphate/decaprenyl-phosphate GlcNAc-1-phosphate transferase